MSYRGYYCRSNKHKILCPDHAFVATMQKILWFLLMRWSAETIGKDAAFPFALKFSCPEVMLLIVSIDHS